MSFEVIQTVGKYQYIYLAEEYRNADGLPRQKRTVIGKIDLKTGQKNYKQFYLDQMQLAGTPIAIAPTIKIFSLDDILKSSIRSFGLFYLIRNIATKIGLLDALSNAIPDLWQEIFMLACYMISTSDPLMYCNEWIMDTESFQVGSMSSQRISELLSSLSPEQREKFYQFWHEKNAKDEYLALDITSHSSYSKLIEDVEWGYNRDHDQLPQINLCMLMGESSRLPIYQSSYSGSLKDVRTLKTTLSKFSAVTNNSRITLVMDKGFYSQKNIDLLLGSEENEPVKFLISMPFTSAFAKKQIESERKDIDCIENTIVVNGYPLRAVTKERTWNKAHKVFTHIYYSAKKANGIREELYAKVALLREKAEHDTEKSMTDEECKKYLIIRKSDKQESGFTINIRKDVLDKMLETAGWVILISNDISNAKKAMSIYRDKDVVEKGFYRLKNSIDLGRLRVHSDDGMQNKLLVGFLASVIMAEINRVMDIHDLYAKYTMKEMCKILEKLRIQDINNHSILYPVTKEQRKIFEAFNVPIPNV